VADKIRNREELVFSELEKFAAVVEEPVVDKQDAPFNNLQAFGKGLINSIKIMNDNIDKMASLLDKDQEKFTTLAGELSFQVNQHMNGSINKLIKEHLQDNQGFAAAVEKKVVRAWQQIVAPAISAHYSNLKADIDGEVKEFKGIDLELPGFKQHTRSVSTRGKSFVVEGAVAGTAAGTAVAAATATTASAVALATIGASVAGPVGIIAGGLAGGLIGLLCSSKDKQHTIVTGDNRFEVSTSTRKAVEEVLIRKISSRLETISHTLHRVPKRWLGQTRQALLKVEERAKEL